MHRRTSHAFLIHRKVFRTPHRRRAASQRVAGPLDEVQGPGGGGGGGGGGGAT